MTHRRGELGRFPVRIAGRKFDVDPREIRRRFLPWRRDSFFSGGAPGDATLSTEGMWWLRVNDWSLGAGQTYQDLETSSLREFWQGRNVDVWAPGRIGLLPALEQVYEATGEDNHKVEFLSWSVLVSDGDEVYVAPASGPGTVFTPTGIQAGDSPATHVEDLAADDSFVYAALGGNGIHRWTLGAGASSLSTFTADGVFVAKGRLLASDGGQLVEIDGAGTPSTLETLSTASFVGWRWMAVADAPNGIYAAASTNYVNGRDISRIFFIGIEQDGTLAPPVMMVEWFNERLLGMGEFGGLIVIVTDLGVRVAQIAGDDSLVYGPAVRPHQKVGEVETMGADSRLRLDIDRQGHVYVPVNNLFAEETPSADGLASFKLSEFVAPLVPAYAADVFESSPDYTVTAAAVFGALRFFALGGAGATARGLWRTSFDQHLAESGFLVSGWIRNRISDDKEAVAFDVRLAEPLPAGATVIAAVIEPDGTETACGTMDTAGETTARFAVPSSVDQQDKFRMKVTLTRATDPTDGPLVDSMALYVRPNPKRLREWVLPLDVSTARVDHQNTVRRINTSEAMEEFDRLVTGGGQVSFEFGEKEYLVFVEDVALQEDSRRRWTKGLRFVDGQMWVRLMESQFQGVE